MVASNVTIASLSSKTVAIKARNTIMSRMSVVTNYLQVIPMCQSLDRIRKFALKRFWLGLVL